MVLRYEGLILYYRFFLIFTDWWWKVQSSNVSVTVELSYFFVVVVSISLRKEKGNKPTSYSQDWQKLFLCMVQSLPQVQVIVSSNLSKLDLLDQHQVFCPIFLSESLSWQRSSRLGCMGHVILLYRKDKTSDINNN